MAKQTRSKFPPSKVELANWKVQAELGLSGNAIAKQTGRDGKTVRKWLKSEVYDEDTTVQELVVQIREKESADLLLLGAKARARLHELIPKETKLIPLVALMDRSFQQVRLISGRSTSNASLMMRHYRIAEAQKPISVVSPRECLERQEQALAFNGGMAEEETPH